MQPFTPGWPDLFIAAKRGKRYQIVTKLPNCHKIYQMPIEYTYFLFQGPRKLPQIWISGSKTYHLATLSQTDPNFCCVSALRRHLLRNFQSEAETLDDYICMYLMIMYIHLSQLETIAVPPTFARTNESIITIFN
jgi:hypothetical protein